MIRFNPWRPNWKHPDYTGTNRCLPCTVVNVLLAAAFALVATALTAAIDTRLAVLVGSVVLGCSIIVIYFRGYLVPRTPELTKRYAPRWVLSAFGKDHPEAVSFDPDTELRSAGLVVEGAADLRLLPAFEREWADAIDDIGDSDIAIEGEIIQRLATLGGFGPETLELEDGPRSFRAWYGDELIASWESRAACIADIAASDVIPDYDSAWYDRPLAVQAELLGALRLFLERCPVCNDEVTLAREVVSSCCYDYNVVATTCNGCNARLFEIETGDELPDVES